jgi:hypothetical protein
LGGAVGCTRFTRLCFFFLSFFFCEFFSLFLAGEEEYKGYPVMAPPRWIDRCSCGQRCTGYPWKVRGTTPVLGPRATSNCWILEDFFGGGLSQLGICKGIKRAMGHIILWPVSHRAAQPTERRRPGAWSWHAEAQHDTGAERELGAQLGCNVPKFTNFQTLFDFNSNRRPNK